jgi:hypothetical protein
MNNLHRGIAPYLLRRYAEGGDVDVEEGKARARSMMENFMRPSEASPMELLQSYGNELFGEGLGATMGAVADVATLPPKLLAYPFLPEKLQEDIKFFPTMEEGAKAGRKIYEDVTGELPELDPRDKTMVGIAAMLTPTPGGKAKGIETIVEESPWAKIGNKNPDTGFYSGLEYAAYKLPQEKGTGDQMLAMLKKNPGAKPEEIEWTGLGDFLKGKESVTKDDIADYLLQNKVDVQVQTLGPNERKFDTWVLPGGENYREILLKTPENRIAEKNFQSSHFDEPNIIAHMRVNDRMIGDRKTLFAEEIQSDWHQAGREKGYKGKTPETITEEQFANAYAKAKDALKNEGMLGFDNVPEALSSIRRHDDYVSRWDIQNPETIAALDEYRLTATTFFDEARAANEAVPDAPFKNNAWVDLALRKLVEDAVSTGHASVSFPKGVEQLYRYQKVLPVDNYRFRKGPPSDKDVLPDHPNRDNLLWVGVSTENGDELALFVDPDTYKIVGDPTDVFKNKNASEVLDIPKKQLEEIYAKGRDEIFSTEANPLVIKDVGLDKFYDNVVVNKLNKLGKVYGSKVTDAEVTLKNDATADAWEFVITPQLAEAVKNQGVPLFAKGGEVNAPDLMRGIAPYLMYRY